MTRARGGALYPLLLAVPFLVGIAVLKGLTVEIDTFHGSDARVYHLPTILQFSQHVDLEHYPAAQTPLYHLIFAGYGKVAGFELWKLRLLNVVISYGAVLALYRLLRRATALEPVQAFALSLAFALSPYFLGASFTLLTDNLAILFALLALERFDRCRSDGSLAAFAVGAAAMAGAVLTRQSFLWLAVVAAWAILRAPLRVGERAAAAGVAALSLAPMAALVALWGGLVPPDADPATCGLCTERPGVGRDALTLRTVGFTVALLGIYAAAVHGPRLVRRRALLPGPRALAAGLATAVLLLAVSPLEFRPPAPGVAGDAGWLWKVADRLPTVAGSSLVFWVLVPLGAVALVLLVRRAGLDSLPTAYTGSFLLAALPVALVYQKYFDPFALLAIALFTRPPDLRAPPDYAGIALVCAASIVYAFSFAGS
ncbi:MAG TPA: glycosyltransferase family 39 protein [Thermoleophilaceae bacterium]